MSESKSADEAFKKWRTAAEYPQWNDFKVYHAENGTTLGVVETQIANEHERQAWAAAWAARGEHDLKAVEAVKTDHHARDGRSNGYDLDTCDEITRRIVE